jgi:hypothetical protein
MIYAVTTEQQGGPGKRSPHLSRSELGLWQLMKVRERNFWTVLLWCLLLSGPGRVISGDMRDIKQILSGDIKVEEIVFSYRHASSTTGEELRHYIGATSSGRFLLIRVASPADAKGLIDSSRCGELYACDSDTRFFKCGSAVVACQKKEGSTDREASFRAMESFLLQCVHLCFPPLTPGSLRWDGDNFTGESSMNNAPLRQSVRIIGRDGKEVVSESEKEAMLHRLQQDPSKAVMVSSKLSFQILATTNQTKRGGELTGPPSSQPNGERLEGLLVRDATSRVTGFLVRAKQPYRVEFDYSDSASLEPPFPSHVRLYTGGPATGSGTLRVEMVIHSVRTTEDAVEESAFNPWPRLRGESFVRGNLMPNGKIRIPERRDQIQAKKMAETRIRESIGSRGSRWFMIMVGLLVSLPFAYFALRKPRSQRTQSNDMRRMD